MSFIQCTQAWGRKLEELMGAWRVVQISDPARTQSSGEGSKDTLCSQCPVLSWKNAGLPLLDFLVFQEMTGSLIFFLTENILIFTS